MNDKDLESVLAGCIRDVIGVASRGDDEAERRVLHWLVAHLPPKRNSECEDWNGEEREKKREMPTHPGLVLGVRLTQPGMASWTG